MAVLSIIGFLVGSLSFMVTVRNAIEQLLLDADASKVQTEILIPLSGRLDLLSIHLKIWQTFWHVHDGTPSDLFSSYWGERGSEEIRKLLSHVYSHFAKVEVEFWAKYSHVPHELIRRRTDLNFSQGGYSKEKDMESLEILTRCYARMTNRIQRLNTALFTGSIFHKHLENLENSVKLLQDISQSRFVECICAYNEAEWKDHVDYTPARDHLTHLAGHSSLASQALRDLVEGSKDHNIDFYLDHGASPDQRQKQVFRFARECYIPYYFYVSPRHSSSEVSVLRLQCQEAKESSISNISWDQSLQGVLQKLCCSENPSDGLRATSEPRRMRLALL